MKRIITLLLFFLFQLSVFGQRADIIGGTPAENVTKLEINIPQNNQIISNELSELPPSPPSSSNPTGNSTEVGVTAGQLSVSLTGGAVYDIPIAVPPGINGVIPQISLSYNSQAGNGLAGYGWNITGISVITRISATKFHDGTIDAVDFDSLDRFSLDGKRFMVKNGTSGVYGADGTIYETESFSNIKITSYGVHPNGANYGPSYFKVEYPDGSFAIYGNDSNSRTRNDWAITYWQNPQGVRISYTYTLHNNNLSISSIKYGSRLIDTPINEIIFAYKTRQRPEQAYIGEQNFSRTTILNAIQVKGKGIGYSNYYLQHDVTSLGYERLTSILEKSGDNSKSLNPTVFSYDNTSENVQFVGEIFSTTGTGLGVSGIALNNSSHITGDFDGDGKMDFIIYPTTGNDSKKKYWMFSGITSGNSNNILPAQQVFSAAFEEIFPVSWLNHTNILMPSQGWNVIRKTSSTNVKFEVYSGGSAINPILIQYDKSYNFPRLSHSYYKEPCSGGGPGINPGEPGIDPGIIAPSPREIPMDESLQNLSINNREPIPLEPIGEWTVLDREIPKHYLSGDFNGDGLSDIVAIEKKTSLSYQNGCQSYTINNLEGKSYFIELDRRKTTNFVKLSGTLSITTNSKFYIADFNGDGKSDLFVFDSKKLTVYSLSDNNMFVQVASITNDNGISLDYPILLGDYNGDGKIDFIIPEKAGKKFYRYLSDGVSFVKTLITYDFEYKQSQILQGGLLHSHFLIPNDFNSDGKTDIIQLYIVTRNDNHYAQKIYSAKYFKNTGTNFQMTQDIQSDWIPELIHYPVPIFLDHNNISLGQSDLCIMSDNKIYAFKSEKNHIKDTQLKSITLGNGLKKVITYSPLIDHYTGLFGIAPYQSSLGSDIYPNVSIDIAPSTNVVAKLEHFSNNQSKQQLYRYYGAVSNAEGLGFLGFRELHKTNWFNENNQAITTVTKHDITKRGAVSETYTIQGAYNPLNYTPTNYITRTETTYDDELLSNNVYKIKNIESRVNNALEGSSNITSTIYDEYNNPLEVVSSVFKATFPRAQSRIYTDIKILQYDNNTSGSGVYYIGRPKKVETTLQTFGIGGSPPLYMPPVEDTHTSEELYTYNSSQLLTKVQKKGNDTNYLTEDNIYDVFGNITKKTITAQGLTPRVTEYTYDTSGRLLLTAKDIEGLVTTYSYNISNGSLLSETLPHNAGYPLTTTFEYDVWGKQVKVIDYLGKKLTTNYFKHPNDNKKTVISNTSDSGNISYEIYDQLGQKLATSVRDITASNWSTKQFIYDNQGKLIQESKPFFTSNPIGTSSASQWDTTSYDIYGRVTQQVLHTGKTTNITYNGLTTTSDDGVKTTTVTKNAIGNIVSLTDNGGTITYKYYADGNLKESDYGGIKVSIEQDGWGRKTKLIDPSAGIYTYEYNDFGELKKETTPNGTTLYILDDYGKLVSKSINGANTNTQSSYTYNPTTKLLEEVVHIDSQESITTTYTYGYDDYRRLWKTIESGALALFENSTVFDTFGRSEKEYHKAVLLSDMKTSGKTIKNIYKNGYHWQILDDTTNQVLWQTNTTNERGQLTEGQFGNGVMVTNTYDQYGLPSLIKHQKTGGVNPINMQLGTAIDAQRGNLMGRTNNLFDWDETFVYDELDRLTEMSKSLELIHRNDFKETTNGFYKKHDTDAIVVISNEKLKVTAKAAYSGVYKDFYNSANIGDKFNVQISVDKGTTQNVRILIIEYNPQTGAWNESIKKITTTTGTELIDFQHTVTQYPLVALYIDKSDTSDAGTSTYFFVDDFKAHKIVPKQIVYDDRGRIENNSSIGEYLYENTASPYRNTGINLTQSGELYYDYNPKQSISYNAFKAPVDIFEEDKERLSFRYNASRQRSTMFYGDLNENKLLRAQRKHYSADGTMEIKHNVQTGAVEFITYIGGNAYTAPVVFRSSYPSMLRPSSSYLYLHRDYQGSIIAISNQEGQVVEKRLFDAWGNILKVQNGQGKNLLGLTILDRGYTGHEHLQAINIIHMNGRLYDPVVHRFLQPDNFIQDPFNTQNFNRYGYCYNNPFMYTDPSGEWIWAAVGVGALIGAIAGGASYVANAIMTKSWDWGQFVVSVGGGAIIGGISGGIASSVCTVTTSAIINAAGSAFMGAFAPSFNTSVGDWNFSVSPAMAFGTGGEAFGVGAGVGYNDGKKWSFSVNGVGRYGGNYSYGGGFSYSNNGKQNYSLGFTHFGGSDAQNNWFTGYSSGDYSFKMTNDAFVGGDKYRTAAAEFGYKNYSFGFNLYTTAPPDDEYNSNYPNRTGGNTTYESPIWKASGTNKKNNGNPFYTYSSGSRVFAGIYFGIKRGNSVQRIGYDGAFVQDFFQNGTHRHIVKGPYFNTNLGSGPNLFLQNFTNNPWTLYSH